MVSRRRTNLVIFFLFICFAVFIFSNSWGLTSSSLSISHTPPPLLVATNTKTQAVRLPPIPDFHKLFNYSSLSLVQYERIELERKVRIEYQQEVLGLIPRPHSYPVNNTSVLLKKPHLFLHVPKTAGSTLAYVFRRSEGFNSFLHVWYHPRYPRDHETLLPGRGTVYGHFRYGLHMYYPNQTCSYLTMLREPVDRVVSHYYFHLQNKKDPGHTLARDHSFREWLDLSPAAHNEMVRCLSGIRETEIFPTNTTLAIALRHLRDFGFVGLTERFNESLVLLRYYAGLKNVKYTKTNKGTRRPKLQDLPPDVVDRILEVNWMDVVLYKEAQKIFEEQLKKAPPTFQKEVDELNKMSKLY